MGVGTNNPLCDTAFLKEILDKTNTHIYITDTENDQIVYMNQAMKESFSLEHPEGRICWEVLQEGMERRCEFCMIDELLRKDGDDTCVWKEQNTRNGRSYRNYDCIIRWNGRHYHVQSSVDVTDYETITQNAITDDLTGALSRRAGIECLSELVTKARREEKDLAVALLDVNDLKLVNDRFGHTEGDRLLTYITDVVKQNMGPQDILFRLSGDEFVVVFYDRDITYGEERMEWILKQLREERIERSVFYDVSFSYGLLEVLPGDRCAASDVLSKADEKMYVQKRNYHIAKARERLAVPPEKSGIERFDYDKEHLFEALTCGTDDYMFVGNMQTGAFRYSPLMVNEFGLPGEVVENAAAFWSDLIHPDDEQGFMESNQEIADGRTDYHCIEYRAKNKDGEWIWLRCRGKMVRDENGNPGLFAGMITNLGGKNQLDHMTGLYNRFEFEGAVKKNLADCGSSGKMGIIILDMDSFKNINDLYNRSFGDEVLRVTARKISELLPPEAEIYRLDGDEFGIVIQSGDVKLCFDIFYRIQQSLRGQQELGGKKYYCTISGGYAAYPQDAESYQELLQYANYSLEHSKLMGKNKITVFSTEILRKKKRRLELVELLRESVERGFSGFFVHYQPQIEMKTGKLYGAEALARWRCGKLGDISPVEFIPLLEQSGMIIQMGMWIFRQAVAQCARWSQKMPDFHMSVNLSYLQLLEGDMAGQVEKSLKEFNVDPANITLELTETYLIKEDEAIHHVLQRLRAIGVRIAMDDFGVGYSSLFSLKNTPVDIVKIDRGFVKGLTSDRFNVTFIRAIAELCHNAGKMVCLEGVETGEEFNVIKSAGLELIQGFYFGRPVSPEEFENKFLQGGGAK